MNILNFGTSRKPSTAMPHEETMDRSCTVPEKSPPNNLGSSSVQRSMLNEARPMSCERSTTDRVELMITAKPLMDWIVSWMDWSSSAVTRSHLFSRMRSAKATCWTASLTAPSGLISSKWRRTFFASARQMTESIRKLSSIHWFDLSVARMGAGSASPVVSNITASNCLRLGMMPESVRTKSPRMLQHAQPLSICTRSSLDAMFSETSFSSMLISPNSFSMTQMRFPFCSFRI
mmetsp:Transcript_8276/g.27238  ORF Transcript_8276/g.27238 Transcript_8276/m.27238 type:complete len:233 (+) Transcript_8276:371-1069(+)